MSVVPKQITIIGLGLIGSSMARAAKQYNLAGSIVGCDPNEIALSYGKTHKFLDVTTNDPTASVKGSQIIVIATPPSALEDIARAIGPALEAGSIVIDVASVKRAAVEAIAPHIPKGVDFIPAHPIAGSEQSGVGAGRADLFQQKQFLLTPEDPTETPALQMLTQFLEGMGARVEGMPAALHDVIYAYVSHLPQLLSTAAALTLAKDLPVTDNKMLEKFLRISHSNAGMWMDIFDLNRDNVIAALDRYLDVLLHVEGELRHAPVDQISKQDMSLARTTLFPRIAASCLITTVMEAEAKAGFSFARYTGGGFVDVASPAAVPPDDEIELISGHYEAVGRVLDDYAQTLVSFRAMIAEGEFDKLKEIFSKVK